MRYAHYTPFRTDVPAPAIPSGSRKPRRVREISRSPVRVLSDEWSRAITITDRHSTHCRYCNRRRNDPTLQVQMGALTNPHLDPYRQCLKARRLEADERKAREAYVAAGGVMPVPRGLKALLVVLVPLALVVVGRIAEVMA